MNELRLSLNLSFDTDLNDREVDDFVDCFCGWLEHEVNAESLVINRKAVMDFSVIVEDVY